MAEIVRELQVRPCAPEDLPFVYALTRENMVGYADRHRGGWKDELFWAGIEQSRIFLAWQSGEKVACLEVKEEADAFHLLNLQVRREFQGRGIGGFLLAWIEAEAIRRGFRRIKLSVFSDNPARIFYLKRGFNLMREEGPDVYLEKNLAAVREG